MHHERGEVFFESSEEIEEYGKKVDTHSVYAVEFDAARLMWRLCFVTDTIADADKWFDEHPSYARVYYGGTFRLRHVK